MQGITYTRYTFLPTVYELHLVYHLPTSCTTYTKSYTIPQATLYSYATTLPRYHATPRPYLYPTQYYPGISPPKFTSHLLAYAIPVRYRTAATEPSGSSSNIVPSNCHDPTTKGIKRSCKKHIVDLSTA